MSLFSEGYEPSRSIIRLGLRGRTGLKPKPLLPINGDNRKPKNKISAKIHKQLNSIIFI